MGYYSLALWGCQQIMRLPPTTSIFDHGLWRIYNFIYSMLEFLTYTNLAQEPPLWWN